MIRIVALVVALIMSIGSIVQAERRAAAAGAGKTVNIPYRIPDNSGNQWMVYHGGYLMHQGNSPTYSQAAMVMLNGNQPNMRSNLARIDDKSGEVIIDDMQCQNNILVTRRILVNKEDNWVRVVDIFRSSNNQETSANLQIQANLNYGVSAAQTINDPRKKDQELAWVAQTGNGRTVLEIYGGKGAKTVPDIQYQQGNSMVQGNMNLTIPAGKQVAFVHFHALVNSMEAGTKWVTEMRENKLMNDLPRDIRKAVVNFNLAQNFIGDVEIIRGDMQDVVEMRTGDVLRGNLKDELFPITTAFGEVKLPAEKVVSIINIGQFRPRTLFVTSDGQIFGGALKKTTLDLELSSGQTTQIPLSQINRAGYRKRSGEPEEIGIAGAHVLLRTGDRFSIKPPAGNVEVQTRYGKLSLTPASIGTITFQVEEHGVHDIVLTDGSKFAGIVSADAFEFILSADGPEQKFTVPTAAIARLTLNGKADESPIQDNPATMKLINNDLLVGKLNGQLKLDTAFDTIAINGAEVRAVTRNKDSITDLQVVMWDQSTITGQLQAPTVECRLDSGPVIIIPAALIDTYIQPLPQPSASMVNNIKKLVDDLNAEDFKTRDRAEQQLVQLGNGVISVLKEARPTAPPEAQQRIDNILQQLGKKDQPAPANPGGGGAMAPFIMQQRGLQAGW